MHLSVIRVLAAMCTAPVCLKIYVADASIETRSYQSLLPSFASKDGKKHAERLFRTY
jgi:hypothetical protein